MPDYIIYRGDTIATYNLILEYYLQKTDTTKTEELFGLSFRGREGVLTSCWRGYQAIYKIENDSIFLVNITYCGEFRSGKIDEIASSERIKEIFKEKFNNGKVFIDWFSGSINFPLNNNLLRWDGVFYKIYEKETVIEIINGKVKNIQPVVNYEKVKNAIDRKEKNAISDIIFNEIKKTKWKSNDKYDCSEKYLITINEKGVISKVQMLGYETDAEIEEYWDKDEYNYCINKMKKVLKKLKFDILKDKGIPIAEDIYIEIWFNDDGTIENWTN